MASTSIIDMTIDYLATYLTTKLITEVTDFDDQDTVAEEVRAGQLQDDPTRGNGIFVLIHPNNRIDEGYKHS